MSPDDRLTGLEARCKSLERQVLSLTNALNVASASWDLNMRGFGERIGMIEQNRRYKLELFKSPEGQLPEPSEQNPVSAIKI
jgi:hypothetical protein